MKKYIFIVGSVILLSVMIVEAVLLTRLWDPLWNPFRPSPEEVITQSFQKSLEIDTVHLDQVLKIKGTGSDLDFSISIVGEGDYDYSEFDFADPYFEKTKSQTTYIIDVVFENVNESSAFSLMADVKTIGGVAYVKVDKIPEEFQIFFALFLGIDSTSIENQWIKIDQKEFLESLGDSEELQEYQKTQKERQKKLLQEILNILTWEDFYEIAAELPDEKINGRETYHYLIDLKLAKLMDRIILQPFELVEDEAATDEEFVQDIIAETVRGVVESFTEKIGGITLEIWIDKQDFFVKKTAFKKTIALNTFSEELKGELSILWQLEASRYNEPVTIEAPENTKTLQEISSSSFIEARSNAKDARIIADMRQYRALAEILYSRDGSYVQVNKEKDFKTIEEDIVVQGGANLSVEKTASNSSFCAKVQLNSKEWYCIDSDYRSSTFNSNPLCAPSYVACQ